MKNPNEDRRTGVIMAALGIIPVTWAALMVAPFLSQGLAGIVAGFTSGMNDPLKISWCADSVKAILIFLVIYGMGIGVYLSTRRNYRKGEEHGSAKWGDARQLCKKYANKNKQQNIILTQNARIGLDGGKHRRNLNVMVVGGSGAGKTRFYAKPNIMQANTSFVVLDPKGEILRDTGGLLATQDYDIKVLDLIRTERSHGFNPFVYLRDDKDVLRLVSKQNIGVASGVDEATLENGPGWLTTSASPGQEGVCVVYGHRNRNHLKPLEKVDYGDTILVTVKNGAQYHYRVESVEIVGTGDELRIPTIDGSHLMLVTCYPFYYSGHAPEKFVVLSRIRNE